MRMAHSRFICSLVAVAMLSASSALAVPYDGNPKILLHVMVPTQKNTCAQAELSDCREATVFGSTGVPRFVYVLAVGGDLPAIGGIEFGIKYDHESTGEVPGSGVDVFDWTLFGTLQWPSTNWPASGGGNLVTWREAECPPGEVGVAGYFYVGAYSADTMTLIARPISGTAKIATCASAETELSAADLGYVVFASCSPGRGCNPCVRDCSASLP